MENVASKKECKENKAHLISENALLVANIIDDISGFFSHFFEENIAEGETLFADVNAFFGTQFVKGTHEVGAELREGANVSRLRGEFQAQLELRLQLLRVETERDFTYHPLTHLYSSIFESLAIEARLQNGYFR